MWPPPRWSGASPRCLRLRSSKWRDFPGQLRVNGVALSLPPAKLACSPDHHNIGSPKTCPTCLCTEFLPGKSCCPWSVRSTCPPRRRLLKRFPGRIHGALPSVQIRKVLTLHSQKRWWHTSWSSAISCTCTSSISRKDQEKKMGELNQINNRIDKRHRKKHATKNNDVNCRLRAHYAQPNATTRIIREILLPTDIRLFGLHGTNGRVNMAEADRSTEPSQVKSSRRSISSTPIHNNRIQQRVSVSGTPWTRSDCCPAWGNSVPPLDKLVLHPLFSRNLIDVQLLV